MAKQLQLRRGTTAQHATFTGAVGEVTIDTDKDVAVVHDGSTAGGFPSQKQLVSGTNIKTINDTALLGSGNISIGVSSLSDTSISSPLSGQVLSYNGINWENVTFSALDAYSKEDTDILLAAKQETLVSGTNIKTVNSTTLLGSGDVTVQPTLVSGTNIKTVNGTSLLGSGDVPIYTGFKNHIINGNFDVWQRGTSQTADGYGSDDRWGNSNAGSTKTHSQVACTDTERALFNASYFSRTVVSSVAGVGNYCIKFQRIENITKLAGKTVTISFWAKADSNKNIAIELEQFFGTGGSPSSSITGIGSQLVSLTSTWQKKSIAVTIPSIVGKTLGTDGANTSCISIDFWLDAGSNFNSRAANLGQQSGTFDIAQVQLEEGSVATPFEQRPYGLELSLCQRYYEKSFALGTAPADGVYTYYTLAGSSDTSGGNTYFECSVTFKTIKRVAPTIAFYGSSGTWQYKNAGPYIAFGSSPFTSANSTTVYGTAVGMGSISGTSDLYRVRMVRGDWTASAEL